MKNKILVLDDDQGILNSLSEILSFEGFEIATAKTAAAFFTKAAAFKPDLIVLDYALQGSSGGEICRQVKATPEFRDTPVILMSGYPKHSISQKQYGYEEFLSKPLDLSELLYFINKYISA